MPHVIPHAHNGGPIPGSRFFLHISLTSFTVRFIGCLWRHHLGAGISRIFIDWYERA